MSKIVLLTDGSSPVPGFEYAVDKLMTDVRSVGYVLPYLASEYENSYISVCGYMSCVCRVTVTTTDQVFELRSYDKTASRNKSICLKLAKLNQKVS